MEERTWSIAGDGASHLVVVDGVSRMGTLPKGFSVDGRPMKLVASSWNQTKPMSASFEIGGRPAKLLRTTQMPGWRARLRRAFTWKTFGAAVVGELLLGPGGAGGGAAAASVNANQMRHVYELRVDGRTAGAWVWTQAGMGGSWSFEPTPQNPWPKAAKG